MYTDAYQILIINFSFLHYLSQNLTDKLTEN